VADELPYPFLQDPEEMARFEGWTREQLSDVLAVRAGSMSSRDFDTKYRVERAILVLDLTGFTETAIMGGALKSFLRVLDAHSICLPVMREFGARFVRTFADDVVALFDEPAAALDAALESHCRTDHFARSGQSEDPARCCIGIGFGSVYAIGPNHSMGDEMNRASKLGEDLARGGETLVTENAHRALSARSGDILERVEADDVLFPYFRVTAHG
jgi:class 3 adenylate cyclase